MERTASTQEHLCRGQEDAAELILPGLGTYRCRQAPASWKHTLYMGTCVLNQENATNNSIQQQQVVLKHDVSPKLKQPC